MLKSQLINTSTGSHTFGISPDGNYFLYWKDNKFQAYNLDAGASRTLGGTTTASFIDTEFDHPGPKPAYGIAGYTTDKKSVIVQHRYDLWELPLDGSAARNLTNGAGTKGEMRFRYVRTEPLEPNLGSLAAGGGGPGGPGGGGGSAAAAAAAPRRARRSICRSRSRCRPTASARRRRASTSWPNGQLKELVYEDAAFSNPVKAAKADKYLFTRQTFIEFPDLRVSGPGLKDAKKISDANPQQKEYSWGRRVLFDYKNKDGMRLQGILALPDDYKPGEKRPMLVTFYEKNSQNMHRYNAPSYLTGMGGVADGSGQQGLHHDAARRLLPHRRVAQRHARVRRGRDAQGDRDGLRRSEAHRDHRPQLRRRRRGVHRHAFAALRRRRHGRGRDRSLLRLQPELGMVVFGHGRVGGANAFDYYLYSQGREGASRRGTSPEMYRFESALTHVPRSDGAVPDHARRGRSDGAVHQRPRDVQRAALTTTRKRCCSRIPAKDTACAAWPTGRT